MKSKMMLAFAIAAMAFSGTTNAQDCGGCGGMVGAYGGGFGSYGGAAFGGGYQGYGGLLGPAGPNDCGRGYTQQQAASLWGGYCNESCVTRGGLFSKCGRRGGCGNGFASAFGYPGNGGLGCSQGCFGYPMGGCCGGGGCGGFGGGFAGCGGGHGGGFLSKILGHFHRGGRGACGSGCGHNSCSLGGFTLFSRLLAKCKSRTGHFGNACSQPVTAAAIDECGCGDSGQYFNYAVGAEYGTAGMQSAVAGEITSGCTGIQGSSVVDHGLNIPAYGNGCQ